MTALAIWVMLVRVPRALWVSALILCALVAGGTVMYRKGEHAAQHAATVKAVADSTTVAVAQKDSATAHSDTVIAVARKARMASDSLRVRRSVARTAALQELCGDPRLPAIQHALSVDDTLSARDSITIAVQAGAIDTLLAERAARERLDALRLRTIAVGLPEPSHHTTRTVVLSAIGGAAVVLTLLHFAR